MKEKSYRLAHYEIILDSNGTVWWKSHGGFAETKRGRGFIEGDILFLRASEEIEPGFLKNEWLEYLKQFPQWDKTGYYCPRFTLYACKEERMRGQKKHPWKAKPSRFKRSKETIDRSARPECLDSSGERKIQQGLDSLSSVLESVENTTESEPMPTVGSPVKSTGGRGLVSQAASAGIEQVKGKLGEALRRCKGLMRHNSPKEDCGE